MSSLLSIIFHLQNHLFNLSINCYNPKIMSISSTVPFSCFNFFFATKGLIVDSPRLRFFWFVWFLLRGVCCFWVLGCSVGVGVFDDNKGWLFPIFLGPEEFDDGVWIDSCFLLLFSDLISFFPLSLWFCPISFSFAKKLGVSTRFCTFLFRMVWFRFWFSSSLSSSLSLSSLFCSLNIYFYWRSENLENSESYWI